MFEIELARRLGRPQTQGVHRAIFKTGHGGIVGHGQHLFAANPGKTQVAAGIGPLFDAAIEAHGVDLLRTWNLPWVAGAQPVIGCLDLEAVEDALLRDPVVIAQSIAVDRQLEGCR